MKKILLIGLISISAVLLYAGGLHFGMTGAVKSKVKELDKKVLDKKFKEENNPENNSENKPSLVLKGQIGTGNTTSASRFAATTSSKINRIVLISVLPGGSDITSVFRVVDINTISTSTFSVDISEERNRHLGVLFVNDDDSLAGALQLSVSSDTSLNMLPLEKLTTGVSEIDLKTISFSSDSYGNIAVPSYDPVGEGKEISITDEEKVILGKLSKVMSSILKNPDANSNGKVDFIEGYNFSFRFQLGFKGCTVSSATADGIYDGVISTSIWLDGFGTNFSVRVKSDIYEKGAGDNLGYLDLPITFPSNYTATHSTTTGRPTQNYVGPNGGTVFPVDGEYVIDASTMGWGPLKFNISGLEQTFDYLLIPVPSFYVENGYLKKITWKWKKFNDINGPNVDPLIFMNNFEIQINTSNARTYNSYGGGATHNWSGVWLNGAECEHIIGVNDLKWSDECGAIDFTYIDKLGNSVHFGFVKPGTLY